MYFKEITKKNYLPLQRRNNSKLRWPRLFHTYIHILQRKEEDCSNYSNKNNKEDSLSLFLWPHLCTYFKEMDEGLESSGGYALRVDFGFSQQLSPDLVFNPLPPHKAWSSLHGCIQGWCTHTHTHTYPLFFRLWVNYGYNVMFVWDGFHCVHISVLCNEIYLLGRLLIVVLFFL